MHKSWFYRFLKRLFDIVSSLSLFVAISPFFFVIFIINAFATKGAPFYSEERVKLGGKSFKLIKFRSMYGDANTNPRKYLNDEQYNQWLTEKKVTNDPRITKFGHFIRKTSIDELPQLINIFIGDMSVVGPRPIVLKELEDNYTLEEQATLVSARPGLVSNWGVNGRNEVRYESGERQKLELEYFETRSLWYDLKLIFKAIGAVLTKKGAQ